MRKALFSVMTRLASSCKNEQKEGRCGDTSCPARTPSNTIQSRCPFYCPVLASRGLSR
eukprot:CAMPEP_0206480114 /NCGR_PEP_ID=MMETSP0324_2-20121206/37061_1 /ASSEMBLY_ACC=CAM_ASM_000836 /TAXON_ID=2866 /ORGANISM="Crypthecodinium cohnii, Strain Seligo" /LENGTH=57 /DNA_ID=CAMNT_0053956759 /DNA_START=68 /DNA_END=238 /DNA_ORIENTATION=-